MRGITEVIFPCTIIDIIVTYLNKFNLLLFFEMGRNMLVITFNSPSLNCCLLAKQLKELLGLVKRDRTPTKMKMRKLA